MNIKLLSASQNLIEEIASNLTSSVKDYSDNLIVFPGKRPSHFLRKALSQREKGSLLPPLIFSMDEFIDYIFEEKLGLSLTKIEPIDGTAVLYDLHKKSSNPLGGESFISPDSFFPIALKIYDAIEELTIEGVEQQRVSEIKHLPGEAIPEQTAGKLQSLAYFYEEFYAEIDKRNFSTRSLRYKTVSEEINEIDFTRFGKIIFAGFFAFTKSEQNLFTELSKKEQSLFIFQQGTGIKEKLNTCFDIKDVSLYADSPVKEPDISLYRSPDAHGQIFGLSKIIKLQVAELSSALPQANGDDDRTNNKNASSLGDNTVIVLPSSDTLFPLFHHTLSLIDKNNYNISMGYPLHRTPIFGFFTSLMNLIISIEGKRFYIPDYLKLVLHPYTKNISLEGDAEITRIMFHSIEKKLSEQRTKSFVTLAEIEEDNNLFNDYREANSEFSSDDKKKHLQFIHNNLLNFHSFNNVSDFAQKSIKILNFIFKNSTARLHPFFYPFYEEFIKSFDLIAGSLLKDMSFNDAAGYFNFFRKYIMLRRTPFEGTPVKGIQVLGFLETRNLKFDKVFVLDVNEGVLPNAGKEDFLLPHKVREILGLPTYKDREIITAYYFDALVKSAKEVHLFFVEKDQKEKSRFVEKIIWKKEKREKKTGPKDFVNSVNYKVKLHRDGPTPVNKTREVAEFLKNYSYSATTIDTYLKCPLMFYYKHVLYLEEKTSVTGKIEKFEIGNFVHKVLSAYFQKRRGKILTAEDIDITEIEELTDRLFKEDFGKEPTGAAYLLNMQVKKRMKEFLEKYQLPMIKNNEIEIMELEYPVKTSINSFNLKGKLDRIEKRNKKIFIMDYKTSSNENNLKINFKKLDPEDRNSWPDSIGTLQLPFYLMLFNETTSKRQDAATTRSYRSGEQIEHISQKEKLLRCTNIENLNGLFLPLSRLTIDEKIELPLFQSSNEASQQFPVLRDIIFKLLREIVNPNIPFAPNQDREKSCSFCDYKKICGV